MFNLKLCLVRTINVPISLLSKLRKDKSSVEMLACAIMIKRSYQNSTLYATRVTDIMAFFKVSHKKAKKLMENFKTSELFVCQSNGNIFVKSFKNKDGVVYGKGKRRYVAFADYCCKVQLREDISLRDTVRELRNILITCAIDSKERRSNLKNARHNTVEHPVDKAVTQKVLGSVSGLSRSSVSRYLKRLNDDGRVSKTLTVAECVISHLNDTTERAWRQEHPKGNFFVWHSIDDGGWSGWQHHGSIYAILNRRDSEKFRHVIYNYRRRNTHLQPSNSAEIDGLWQN